MSIDLKAPEFLDSILVEDVTDANEKLETAFDLLIAGYRALSSIEIDSQEIRTTVCCDPYHRYGLSRTLLLTALNPETCAIEPFGTMRITPASAATLRYALPPLEAMELMAPEEGWNCFRFDGFDVMKTVEGGRIAISASCRTPANRERQLPLLVLNRLIRVGFEIGTRDFGKTQYWGILPSYMIRRFEAAGIHVIPAPGVHLQPERHELFQRYDRYWLKSDPCFCKVIVNNTLPQ